LEVREFSVRPAEVVALLSCSLERNQAVLAAEEEEEALPFLLS